MLLLLVSYLSDLKCDVVGAQGLVFPVDRRFISQLFQLVIGPKGATPIGPIEAIEDLNCPQLRVRAPDVRNLRGTATGPHCPHCPVKAFPVQPTPAMGT